MDTFGIDEFMGTLSIYNLGIDDVIFQQDNDPKHKARLTVSLPVAQSLPAMAKAEHLHPALGYGTQDR